jgi:hypothetical protein
MIVQATDGQFYRNPIVIRDKFLLEVTDDGSFIKRKGDVVWTTAQKGLRGGGVKCKHEETVGKGRAIFASRLEQVSVFRVTLLGRIPVPDSHQGVLEVAPNHKELEDLDEVVISWK